MSASPTSTTTGARRSGRLASLTPAPASLTADRRPSNRRSPTKRATTAKGKPSAASNKNLNSIAESAPPAAPSAHGTGTYAAVDAITSKSAVDQVGMELDRQQVSRSTAYGSAGPAANPEKFSISMLDENPVDRFADAVHAEMERTGDPTPPVEEQPAPAVEAVARSTSDDTAARRRRRGGGSQSSSGSRVSASSAASSSARSVASLDSANALAAASVSGSRSQSGRSSSSRGSGTSTATASIKTDDNAPAPATAPVHATHAVPSGLLPSVNVASFASWFTPLVWLLTFFNKVADLASMAGGHLKHAAWTVLRVLKTLSPLLLLVGLLAGLGSFAMYSDIPRTFVSSVEHLSTPFAVPSAIPWSWNLGSSSGVSHNPNGTPGNSDSLSWASLGNTFVGNSASSPPKQEPVNKINFLAPASGVAIDPYLTSHSRPLSLHGEPLPVPRRPWMQRLFRRPISRFPRYGPGPASCLHKWDDAGECWCGPELNGKAQVGIVLTEPVIPQELVVEHIHTDHITAGAAANTVKDFEMWVKIEDEVARSDIMSASLDVVDLSLTDPHAAPPSDVSDEVGSARTLDSTWVRVGRWQYQRGGSAAQAFAIPVDLAYYNIGINNMVVRTTSSWGDGTDSVCIYRLKLHGLSPDDVASAAGR